jgi:hypothetical protein
MKLVEQRKSSHAIVTKVINFTVKLSDLYRTILNVVTLHRVVACFEITQ